MMRRSNIDDDSDDGDEDEPDDSEGVPKKKKSVENAIHTPNKRQINRKERDHAIEVIVQSELGQDKKRQNAKPRQLSTSMLQR